MSQHPTIGDVVTLKGQFKVGSGLLDPVGAISLTVTDPSGAVSTYAYPAQVTRVPPVTPGASGPAGLPTYQMDWSCAVVGTLQFLFAAGAGDGQGADGGYVVIHRP